MKVKYIANDGTEFDDIRQCAGYEQRERKESINKSLADSGVVLLRHKHGPEDVTQTEEFEWAVFVYVPDEKAAEAFKSANKLMGYRRIGLNHNRIKVKPGIYYWSEAYWCYGSIDDRIKKEEEITDMWRTDKRTITEYLKTR
jgi:hypothetical protein